MQRPTLKKQLKRITVIAFAVIFAVLSVACSGGTSNSGSGTGGSKLATPVLSISDYTLSWSAVPGAESYNVCIDGATPYDTVIAPETSMEIGYVEPGKHTFNVVAYAAGRISGDRSAEVEFDAEPKTLDLTSVNSAAVTSRPICLLNINGDGGRGFFATFKRNGAMNQKIKFAVSGLRGSDKAVIYSISDYGTSYYQPLTEFTVDSPETIVTIQNTEAKLFMALVSDERYDIALSAEYAPSPAPGEPGYNPGTEEADSKRTKLYVYNYNGGYGYDWLVSAKIRYEALHAEDELEPGHTGVQIIINNQKMPITSAADFFAKRTEEVYFVEGIQYYDLIDVAEDITEAVTADLSEYGDPAGTTILGKLNDQQKEGYGVSESDGLHYYAIPHYSGFVCLTYNKALFDEHGLYFAKNQTPDVGLAGKFISGRNSEKSLGFDGKTGVQNGVDYSMDDGLPTTYEEFFDLLDYMEGMSITPISWSGQHGSGYLNYLYSSLVAVNEGKDNMYLNYKLNGSETLCTVNDNGEVVLDSAPTPITPSNGYELARQPGKYYALQFMQKLVSPSNSKYYNDNAFTGGHSQLDAQDDFLLGGLDGITPRTAMLLDGVWWEAEATNTFNDMATTMGEQFSKTGREFAIMPFPAANEEILAQYQATGNGGTIVDDQSSVCFIKRGLSEEKKKLAMDFVKFANSNESLQEFTRITDTSKAFIYPMSDEQMEGMSPFGKSLYKYSQHCDTVYSFSNTPFAVNNASRFRYDTAWEASVNGTRYDTIARAFHEHPEITPKMYFDGLSAVQRSLPWG